MKKYTVCQYQPTDYEAWNAFVKNAKNATFLFHRDFMEYHADRFEDYSLLVYENEKLISVLPANIVGQKVFSHQGLTYGGFVFNSQIKLVQAIEVIKSVLFYLNSQNRLLLYLKLMPSFYHFDASEEINYALFLLKAKLVKRNALSVIDKTRPFQISKTRKESIRRGIKNRLVIKEDLNLSLFWNEILIPNLKLKHDAKPVHSVDEISKLQKLFPKNIRHFNVYHEGKIVAGSTIFVTDNVAHPQYISGNENNNELGSLDFLYHELITNIFKDQSFFDFGPSHENESLNVKNGILFWKESYGAKTIVQDFYEINTNQYNFLENIFI